MASGFNSLITALIVVFALTFVALLAEIFYILRRRRQSSGSGSESAVHEQAKERAYCFWWRKQSRIEPNEIQTRSDDESDADSTEEKWRQLCGASRVLFTIKEEEEREGIEPLESEFCCISEKKLDLQANSLDHAECKTDLIIRIDVDDDDDPTPFGTPCGSPPYYTPSPSPTRENGVSGGDRTSICSVRIPGD